MKNATRIVVAAILSATPLLISVPSHAIDPALASLINTQTYHLTLSGTVNSNGGASAGTEVRVEVKPIEGPVLQASANTRADGSFRFELSFQGYPSGQVDWKVVAQDGRLCSVSHEGRQILMNVPAIAISQSIQLTEDILQLALR